ncbi:MAG: hypothetical protein AAF074_22925, partial [Pseudomonadota bacterium]
PVGEGRSGTVEIGVSEHGLPGPGGPQDAGEEGARGDGASSGAIALSLTRRMVESEGGIFERRVSGDGAEVVTLARFDVWSGTPAEGGRAPDPAGRDTQPAAAPASTAADPAGADSAMAEASLQRIARN